MLTAGFFADNNSSRLRRLHFRLVLRVELGLILRVELQLNGGFLAGGAKTLSSASIFGLLLSDKE